MKPLYLNKQLCVEAKKTKTKQKIALIVGKNIMKQQKNMKTGFCLDKN